MTRNNNRIRLVPGLPFRPVPEWLQKANPAAPFPLQDALHRSLYYPSSGRDGDPVKHLGGFTHSFVCVDSGITRDKLLRSLEEERHRFKGYKVLFQKDVTEQELAPNGYSLPPLRPGDGRPSPRGRTPFAIWAVHQRLPEFDDNHGAERFSLLFICGDGAAAYHALYYSNRCAPEVLAIIQPGHTFGGNWTDFTNPDLVFARSVRENPYGTPDYLLYGQWHDHYEEPCWPQYPKKVFYWSAGDAKIGLWARSDGTR